MKINIQLSNVCLLACDKDNSVCGFPCCKTSVELDRVKLFSFLKTLKEFLKAIPKKEALVINVIGGDALTVEWFGYTRIILSELKKMTVISPEINIFTTGLYDRAVLDSNFKPYYVVNYACELYHQFCSLTNTIYFYPVPVENKFLTDLVINMTNNIPRSRMITDEELKEVQKTPFVNMDGDMLVEGKTVGNIQQIDWRKAKKYFKTED
jgi:hypothetical protein